MAGGKNGSKSPMHEEHGSGKTSGPGGKIRRILKVENP